MHAILRVLMAILAAIDAVLVFSFLRKFKSRERESQVELEFNTRRAVQNFRILLYGEAFLFLGFLTYTLGSVLGRHDITSLGEGIALLFFLAPLKVLHDWRRRLE